MPKKQFLCSDETVNAYGFRVLTSGIQLNNFKKNPVGFFNHNTGDSFWNADPNYRGPVIRWEEIVTEENKLFASPVFDVNDPTGKTLNDKVENDFIRAASIGFRIIETSNDPALMEKGQTYPTITKCELMEISVVDIPANKNALALYDADGKKINLDDSTLNTTLSGFLKNKNTLPKNNTMKLKIIATLTALAAFFGLETGKDHEIETTPEKLTELNAKLQKLTDVETANATLTQEKATAEAKVTELQGSLTAKETEITSLKAQVATLSKPAEPIVDPIKLKNDPAPEPVAEEGLTETDIQARQQHKLYAGEKKTTAAAAKS